MASLKRTYAGAIPGVAADDEDKDEIAVEKEEEEGEEEEEC